MSFSWPLCRLCELPTADGAVQAAQVDKEKLQTWFLDICEQELAEEIEDADLICFFCIWHAEFLAKHVPGLDGSAWWPASLDYLDDTSRELRKKYFEGQVEQCWVQLETIESSESELEEDVKSLASTSDQQKGEKCVYCDAIVLSIDQHMRQKHKDAIRCEHNACATYFHTVDEKEEHEKSKERKMFQCGFCVKKFTQSHNLKRHVASAHPEYSVRCDFYSCFDYFKSKEELQSHFKAAHKHADETKVFKCHFCEHKTKTKAELSTHISCKHLPKTIKCTKCDKMFATKQMLSKHVKQWHTYWVCSFCSADCVIQMRSVHLKTTECKRCRNKFQCPGLYQAHLKTCKETLFKCDQCPKTFKKRSLLVYHLKRKHRNNSWRGLKHKKLGFECEPCKRYYPSANLFKQHLRNVHTKQGFKQCAHCPKSFRDFSRLKNHLAEKHDLIERKCKCDECGRSFVSSRFLAIHIKRNHLAKKKLVNCSVCGKSMKASSLNWHLIKIHCITNK